MATIGSDNRRARVALAVSVVVAIVTQLTYTGLFVASLEGGDPAAVTPDDIIAYYSESWTPIRAVWITELVAYAVAAVSAWKIAQGAKRSTPWIILALGQTLNVIMLGIGFGTFRSAVTAGPELLPVFFTLANGAFLFYYMSRLFVVAGLGSYAFQAVQGASSGGVKALGYVGVVVAAVAAVLGLVAIVNLPNPAPLTTALINVTIVVGAILVVVGPAESSEQA